MRIKLKTRMQQWSGDTPMDCGTLGKVDPRNMTTGHSGEKNLGQEPFVTESLPINLLSSGHFQAPAAWLLVWKP